MTRRRINSPIRRRSRKFFPRSRKSAGCRFLLMLLLYCEKRHTLGIQIPTKRESIEAANSILHCSRRSIRIWRIARKKTKMPKATEKRTLTRKGGVNEPKEQEKVEKNANQKPPAFICCASITSDRNPA